MKTRSRRRVTRSSVHLPRHGTRPPQDRASTSFPDSPSSECHAEAVNWIDRFVGRRLRYRRLELRISFDDFSDRFGVSTQMLAAIESGRQRLGARRLLEASIILDVPISYFFDGLCV
jgi:DNA-binding transcriptional regulator YiaG